MFVNHSLVCVLISWGFTTLKYFVIILDENAKFIYKYQWPQRQRNSAGSLTRPCQQIYHFLALTVEKWTRIYLRNPGFSIIFFLISLVIIWKRAYESYEYEIWQKCAMNKSLCRRSVDSCNRVENVTLEFRKSIRKPIYEKISMAYFKVRK